MLHAGMEVAALQKKLHILNLCKQLISVNFTCHDHFLYSPYKTIKKALYCLYLHLIQLFIQGE